MSTTHYTVTGTAMPSLLAHIPTGLLMAVVKRDRYKRYDKRLAEELQRELTSRRAAERRIREVS